MMSQPHANQPVLTAGVPAAQATAAMALVHGRGAGAASILSLVDEFPHPDFAFVAPQAAGGAWYPHRFIAPLASNEPYLSSALAKIEAVLAQLQADGLGPEKTILLGFSQGACLALEYAARHAQRFGGVVALSGGLIGPPGTVFTYPGSLAGTPVFLGCSDVDFHIPVERVHESAEVLAALGGQVTKRIYPGMGHTVNADELDFVRQLMAGVLT
jgi:predicted esterase